MKADAKITQFHSPRKPRFFTLLTVTPRLLMNALLNPSIPKDTPLKYPTAALLVALAGAANALAQLFPATIELSSSTAPTASS